MASGEHETTEGNSDASHVRPFALRDRWRRWRTGSVNRRVLAASLLLGALTLLCKVAAAGREVATAYAFGTGDAVDAFVVSLALVSFAITVIANAAGSALLPTLAHVRHHLGQAESARLLREATGWSIVMLSGATILLGLCSSWLLPLVSPGFSDEKQALCLRLVVWLLPAVVLHGISSLWSAVLHSRERFAATGLVPIATPLLAIVLIFSAGSTWGITVLAVAISAGALVELTAIGLALRGTGYQILPSIGAPSTHLRRVMAQYLPLVLAGLLIGSTTLIDNAMASQLPSGSVATLNYGRKLVNLAIAIPVFSLSRAVFPYFSQLVAGGRWAELHSTLRTYRRLILAGTIPLAAVMILGSRFFTSILFEHGAFGAASVDSVALVQALYAIQIPFMTLATLYVRLVSSLRLNHLLTISTIISIILNVSLNLLFMRWLGVAGIALSTSVVYAVACAYLLLVTRHVSLAGD